MKVGLDKKAIIEAAASMADEKGVANVTLKVLATELGITRNQMSRIENGRANCTISQLFILLQILGGSADYILFGKKYEREIKITKEQKEVLINLINAFNE